MAALHIDPPLLNSANPWCTTLEQLRDLYNCPHTGAITTRTSLLNGFPHDWSHHQFTFFDPNNLTSSPRNTDNGGTEATTGSLNTLGYSPHSLSTYLSFIRTLSETCCTAEALKAQGRNSPKPVIVSVTGSVEEVVECYEQICKLQKTVAMPLAMELNLSCPNIPGKAPPAYSKDALIVYLDALGNAVSRAQESRLTSASSSGINTGTTRLDSAPHVPLGLKTPPYTFDEQFLALLDALKPRTPSSTNDATTDATSNSAEAQHQHQQQHGKNHAFDYKHGHPQCPVSFITAVNTLGNSLLLEPLHNAPAPAPVPAPSADTTKGEQEQEQGLDAFGRTLHSASGTGIGGLAGAPLHPLALGNVYTIKGLLGQHEALKHICVIGVGGVADKEGYRRMRAVGAHAVGVGTALGRKGVSVFGDIDAAGVERLKNKTKI